MPQAKNNPIAWMTTTFASFLLANTPGLQQVIQGFPNPNEKLKYPSITIVLKTPIFTPLYSSVQSIGAITNHTAPVVRVRGMYDFELQLDLWTAYRPQRDEMVDAIQQAFSTNPSVYGINLAMPDYFGETASLTLDRVQYMDNSESESQRGEWRAMITVLGNMRVLQEQTSAIITTIENTLETPDSI